MQLPLESFSCKRGNNSPQKCRRETQPPSRRLHWVDARSHTALEQFPEYVRTPNPHTCRALAFIYRIPFCNRSNDVCDQIWASLPTSARVQGRQTVESNSILLDRRHRPSGIGLLQRRQDETKSVLNRDRQERMAAPLGLVA